MTLKIPHWVGNRGDLKSNCFQLFFIAIDHSVNKLYEHADIQVIKNK